VIDKQSILYKWACHEDASYHDFSPEQAFEIRESLLTWYRANRRKLPWRGDSPPYGGSTAGVNSGKPKGGQKQTTTILKFFTPKGSTDSASNEQVVEKSALEASKALPVTGYGVWASEIMLQQTRVEAVIPYYLKCTFLPRSPLLIVVTMPHQVLFRSRDGTISDSVPSCECIRRGR
jgi:A/G-specific adenine glycosylase